MRGLIKIRVNSYRRTSLVTCIRDRILRNRTLSQLSVSRTVLLVICICDRILRDRTLSYWKAEMRFTSQFGGESFESHMTTYSTLFNDVFPSLLAHRTKYFQTSGQEIPVHKRQYISTYTHRNNDTQRDVTNQLLSVAV